MAKNNEAAETEAVSPEITATTAEREAQAIIEAARKQAAEIIANAEKQAAQPVEAASAHTDPGEEYVDYMAPLSANLDERDIVVAVNGESIRIMRGVPVRIKRKFVEVLRNADRQKLASRRTMEKIRREGDRAFANM